MKYALFFLLLSGCCCSIPSSDTNDWDSAVGREKKNRQVFALEPGTANVWELEVAYPEDWSQEDEDASAERAAQREVRRLQDALKPHGVDVGELQPLPPPIEKRGLRTAYRLRWVTLFPHVSMLAAEGEVSDPRCFECMRLAGSHTALYVTGFGAVPIDVQTVTREELLAGVKLHERGTYESLGPESSGSVTVPPEGQVQLRLVESCPAQLHRVTSSIHVGNGSGVIAVPKYEDRTWYELRKATCAPSGGVVREEVGATFKTGESAPPSASRLMQLRYEGQQFGVR